MWHHDHAFILQRVDCMITATSSLLSVVVIICIITRLIYSSAQQENLSYPNEAVVEEHAQKTSSDGFVRSPLFNNSSCDDLLRVRAGAAVESHSIGDWGRNFLSDDVQLHARLCLSYPVGRRFDWITHAAAHQLWQHQGCCSELQYRADQLRHNSWSLDISAQITLLCSCYVPRARWISHSSALERFHEVKNRRTRSFRSTPCVAQSPDTCVFGLFLEVKLDNFPTREASKSSLCARKNSSGVRRRFSWRPARLSCASSCRFPAKANCLSF